MKIKYCLFMSLFLSLAFFSVNALKMTVVNETGMTYYVSAESDKGHRISIFPIKPGEIKTESRVLGKSLKFFKMRSFYGVVEEKIVDVNSDGGEWLLKIKTIVPKNYKYELYKIDNGSTLKKQGEFKMKYDHA